MDAGNQTVKKRNGDSQRNCDEQGNGPNHRDAKGLNDGRF